MNEKNQQESFRRCGQRGCGDHLLCRGAPDGKKWSASDQRTSLAGWCGRMGPVPAAGDLQQRADNQTVNGGYDHG